MKIKGQTLTAPKPVPIIIPRAPHGEDVVFMAQPIIEFDEFNSKCKEPEPVRVIKAGGDSYLDYEDKSYLLALDTYAKRKNCWIFLKTISVTPGLEWEVVNMDDPSTWEKFEEELTKAGFTTGEINYLFTEALDVNIMTPEKIEQARERFLSKQRLV